MMIIFIGYFILIASALLFIFPAFALAQKGQNTSGEQLSQIKRKHNLLMTVVFIPVIIAVVIISLQEERLGERFFFLIVPFVSGISFFEGLFAFMTDVYPLHVMDNIVFYWHSTDPVKNNVAKWQMGLAIAFSVISLILYFI